MPLLTRPHRILTNPPRVNVECPPRSVGAAAIVPVLARSHVRHHHICKRSDVGDIQGVQEEDVVVVQLPQRGTSMDNLV